MIHNMTGGGSLSRTARGTIASFNARTDNIPLKSLVVDIDPVQAGTGDPSPENVRPISGWTGVKVQRTGKNLLNYEAWKKCPSVSASSVFENNGVTITATGADGYTQFFLSQGFPTDAVIPVQTGEKITLSWETDQSTKGTVYIFGNGGTKSLAAISNMNAQALTYTVPAGITFITFRFGVKDAGETISYKNIQIERGSTATAYEPYQGDTYDISFPIEAGTVYGGTLDVTTGLLTVDKQGYDMGALNWGRQAGSINPDVYLFRAQAPVASTITANQGLGISTMFATVTANSAFAGHAPDNTIGIEGSYANIRCDSYAEASAFKAAVSGQLVVVPVSPVTYQLTPTEVNTLLGVNNIWADTGDSKAVYWTNPEIIHVINSSGLNLKVVGGTVQPSSPKENTVWVNTDTEISGYAFSATEPENPTEGMVRLAVGASIGSAVINLDKKNTVLIYPTACRQYISGAWVNRDAQVYINGAWVGLTVHDIIREGLILDTLSTRGGRWSSTAQAASYDNKITATQADGYVSIKGSTHGWGAVYVESDLTNAREIVLEGTLDGIGYDDRVLAVWSSFGSYLSSNLVAWTRLTATGAVLDVSSLSGKYYIGLTSHYTHEHKVKEFYTR